MTTTAITICGNTTAEPDLKFGASGVARCSFTVAVNERVKDDQGNWRDGDATFYRCTAWRQQAENVAATVQGSGVRLVVHGKFKARPYEVDGQNRLSLDVDVEHVGPDLRFDTATVNKMSRPMRDGSSPRPTGTTAEDPWSAPNNVNADVAPF